MSDFTVTPHQDGTFLNNDPLKLVGFWFPIDDATLENGCLWYAPGSHKHPVSRRFIRNPDISGPADKLLVFQGEDPVVPDQDWVAAPVKKGMTLSSVTFKTITTLMTRFVGPDPWTSDAQEPCQ